MLTLEINNQKCKTLGCRSDLDTYIKCHEIARKSGVSPSDWLLAVIKHSIANGVDIKSINKLAPVNVDVQPNYSNQNQIITKPKNPMAELNDSPTRAELKIDRLEQEIQKLNLTNTELSKTIEAEKKRANAAEIQCKAEVDAHETTKKETPSKEDLFLLHGSKFDTSVWKELIKNDMKPIFADAKDLEDELGIHPMLYTDLKDNGKTETSNILLEKNPKGVKLPEGKIFRISSKHETK